MNHSPSGIYLSGDLDSVGEILKEQGSTHLITDETSSSCFFDILSGTTTPSFHSSLLGDIELDLQCEDDNVDFEDKARNASQIIFSFNSSKSSNLAVSENLHNERHSVPLQFLTENASIRGGLELGSGIHFEIPFPASNVNTSNPFTCEKVKDNTLTSCEICLIQFSSSEALCAHNKDKHDVKKENLKYGCEVCQVNLSSKKALINHVRIHIQPQSLRDKGGSKYSSENYIYSCDSCPYTCKTRTLLKCHIKTKHDLQRKVFTCEKCTFSCLQERTLMLHIKRHEGDAKFACDQCGKLFLTMGILKRHAHTHDKTRTFLCPFQQCGKSFNIKSRLTDHVRIVHRRKGRDIDVESATDDDTIAKPIRNGYGVLLHDSSMDLDYRSRLLEPNVNISYNDSVSVRCSDDIVVYDVVLPEDEIQKFNRCHDYKSNFGNPSCTSSMTMIEKNATKFESIDSFHYNSQMEDGQCLQGRNFLLPKTKTEGKFVCTWEGCNKKFRDNYNLHVHRCTHTGEMQRACSICRYRCVQKSAMDAHLKTHIKLRLKGIKKR